MYTPLARPSVPLYSFEVEEFLLGRCDILLSLFHGIQPLALFVI
jgi:hypothetical protein